MAINYAEKYSSKVDERIVNGSLTNDIINNDYDFIGVETVKVYSVPTVALNDYQASGTSRYGTPSELENTVQELTMRKDRAFTFTIDRKSRDDTQMTMEAGKALQREIDEVIVPELDTYRLAQIAENCGSAIEKTVTSENAYEAFLSVQELLDDAEAPTEGRVVKCSNAFYKKIKLDDSFTKKGDMATQISIQGLVGEIDGVPVVKVPKSRLPEGVEFIITNRRACTAPIKLSDYIIHEDPPGISGWLVEGRIRYDAFVLNNKKKLIGVCKAPKQTETDPSETETNPTENPTEDNQSGNG